MAEKHFFEQEKHTVSYLIPFFQTYLPNFYTMTVLEIGCAEAGFIKQLNESGITAMGLEIEESRVQIAHKYTPNAIIHVGDITDPKIVKKFNTTFDLIVMRDVIEHITEREQTFANLRALLKDDGYLYITFPAKFSGFAGHQQHARSFLKYTPYLHLLPSFKLKFLGRMLKERPQFIATVKANYKNGLSIRGFEQYCAQFNFSFVRKELFLFRPIFKSRFGLPIIRIPNIPLIREFMAWGCECLLRKN